MTRCYTLLCGTLLAAALIYAEAPKPEASGPVAFTATTANVSGAPDAIRIEILRWSTDAERVKLLNAWELKTDAGDPKAPKEGRGGAGRGGRGAAAPAAKPTPEAMLATALKASATVGYLWSSEIAGYALRYAAKIVNPDGSERVLLITDRRLGAVNDRWKVAGAESPAYDFSVIELRLKPNGNGEGKISLHGGVAPDTALNMVALENYDALPVVLSKVHRRSGAE